MAKKRDPFNGTIHDWAARAAERIADDREASVSRIAAIIETYAQPWLKLLRESRRGHEFQCEGDDNCDCEAKEWNEKVDKALR